MSPALEPRRRSLLSRILWTLSSNIYLLLFTGIFGTAAILTGWVGGGRLFFFWARTWSRGLLAASGTRVKVSFEVPLADRAYLFMANHQSLFDIPLLLATLPGQVRFLAKRELFRLPVFGWALRVGGFIPIDRKDRSSARTSFRSAVARLKGGESVLIFPEETRSPDGRLLEFKRGGFLIAVRSGVDIVPVGIRGTHAVRSKDRLWVSPGPVEIVYGAPIEIRDLSVRDRKQLAMRVRAQVADLAGLAVDQGGSADGTVEDPRATAE